MTIEIKVRHGRTEIDRLFGFSIFHLIEIAQIGKHYENETSHGTLRIFKDRNESNGSIVYNVYYYKNSFVRRMWNYIKESQWKSQ